VKQYGDYIAKGDIKNADELMAGHGAILSKGRQRLAVYRDEEAKLHVFSPVCPHMGCMVQWNAEEKSFDCPCHGSRFTKEGVVINGPATSGLKRIDLKD
jgi:Rieske Fe-S protein